MSRSAPSLLMKCVMVALIAAMPVTFSAWVDPARILGAPEDEREIADALLAGHNVTDVTNYDDRVITRLLAEGRRDRPDVLVLGSSRIQPLTSAAFPGRTFVNGGVSGARLDDILAVYSIYDTKARRPRQIVLNLDPFTVLFDPAGAPGGAFLDTRAEMFERLGSPTLLWRDQVAIWTAALKRLASPDYFRLSVFMLRRHGPRGVRFVVTDRMQNIEKTRTPDGTIVWSATPPEQTVELVHSYLGEMSSDDRYIGLSSETTQRNLELLERFVGYLKAEHIDVTLLLLPYHPEVRAAFDRRADRPLATMERRYREMAGRAGVAIVGSYDPAVTGASASDFFDESHMRPEPLTRMAGGALSTVRTSTR